MQVRLALALLLAAASACSEERGTAAAASEASSATGTGAGTPEPADGGGGTPSTSTAEGVTAPSAPSAPDMAVIPEGAFLMGGQSPENTPVFEAIVARFELDLAEVTVGRYRRCVEAGSCSPPRADNPFCNVHFSDRDDHPVNCVDHRDARAYCAFEDKRLPTESEWEYAARGGSEQRPYSWGDEEPSRHNACYMHEGGSCKVKSYPPGAFGLYDMTGNVWEWTGSTYRPYPLDPEARGLDIYVYRGGSWSRRFAKWMRSDLRNRYREDEQSASLGFRCARDVNPRVCPAFAEDRAGRCVRTRGTPLCPAGESFAQGKCRPGGIVPAAEGAPPSAGAGPLTSATGATEPAPATLTTSRSPDKDGDCAAHYPGLPVAYRVDGGTFQDREPVVRGRGCQKRDVSRTWTSMCCKS